MHSAEVDGTLKQGSISQFISSIRSETKAPSSTARKQKASLKSPNRPVTPLISRNLITNDEEYRHRPTSAQALGSSAFLEGLSRPLSASSRSLQPLKRSLSAQRIINPDKSSEELFKETPTTPSTQHASHSSTHAQPSTHSSAPSSTPPSPRPPTPSTLSLLLSKMKVENGTAALLESVDELTVYVETKDLSPSKRKAVLQVLFNFMDLKDDLLLLKICFVALKIGRDLGSTTTANLCRLLYKLSKNTANDPLFLSTRVTEQLLNQCSMSTEHEHSTEILTYAVGALKNITIASEANQQHLIQLGAVSLLSQWLTKDHLQKLEQSLARAQTPSSTVRVQSATKRLEDKVAQLLVQVAGVLRNLSTVSGMSISTVFNTQSLLSIVEVLDVKSPYCHRYELMLSVSRILSKLTLYNDCKATFLSKSSILEALVFLLDKFGSKPSLVLRVSFVLGNLTATDENCRSALVQQHNCLPLLLKLFTSYATEEQESDDDFSRSSRETTEVVIKLIRLLANLSINPSVGPIISQHKELEILLNILLEKDINIHEELILNTIGFISNLSYYISENNIVYIHQLEIVPKDENEETIVETTRVFGNFSQVERVREMILQYPVASRLSNLLQHPNKEIAFNTCGIIMNLVVNTTYREQFVEQNAVDILLKLLADALAAQNYSLSLTVCKTLYNFSIDSMNKDVCVNVNTTLKYLSEEYSQIIHVNSSSFSDSIKSVLVQCVESLNEYTNAVSD